MRVLPERPPAEIRRTARDERLSRLSIGTLHYMHDYGVAFEEYLRWHKGNLSAASAFEWDLFEAIELCRRLNKVKENTRRFERRNELIRTELFRRQLGDG